MNFLFYEMAIPNVRTFILCGLVILYDYIDLCQHWLRKWLVAWQHQAITWTNVDFLLMKFYDIHLRAVEQQVSKLLFCIISLKIILLKLSPQFPGAIELKD